MFNTNEYGNKKSDSVKYMGISTGNEVTGAMNSPLRILKQFRYGVYNMIWISNNTKKIE